MRLTDVCLILIDQTHHGVPEISTELQLFEKMK